MLKVKLVSAHINKANGIVMYKATFSSPQHYMEESEKLHTVGKELLYPLNIGLGGPQSHSRC